MRRIELSVSVIVDDDVTPQMVRDLLRNQLPLNPVVELATGAVHWRETKVTVIDG
jgi:hypothetical protein